MENEDGIIRARGFEVVDDEGRVRIAMRPHNDGAIVELMDQAGKQRLVLVTTDAGDAQVTMANDKGLPMLHLAVNRQTDSAELILTAGNVTITNPSGKEGAGVR